MKSIREKPFDVEHSYPSARVARSAAFDLAADRLVVELDNGVSVAIPRGAFKGLFNASADDVREVRVEHGGSVVTWPRLEADFCVPEMLPYLVGVLVSVWPTQAFVERVRPPSGPGKSKVRKKRAAA